MDPIVNACETGEQRQRALALLSELLRGDMLEPGLISYSAETSACETGEQ